MAVLFKKKSVVEDKSVVQEKEVVTSQKVQDISKKVQEQTAKPIDKNKKEFESLKEEGYKIEGNVAKKVTSGTKSEILQRNIGKRASENRLSFWKRKFPNENIIYDGRNIRKVSQFSYLDEEYKLDPNSGNLQYIDYNSRNEKVKSFVKDKTGNVLSERKYSGRDVDRLTTYQYSNGKPVAKTVKDYDDGDSDIRRKYVYVNGKERLVEEKDYDDRSTTFYDPNTGKKLGVKKRAVAPKPKTTEELRLERGKRTADLQEMGLTRTEAAEIALSEQKGTKLTNISQRTAEKVASLSLSGELRTTAITPEEITRNLPKDLVLKEKSEGVFDLVRPAKPRTDRAKALTLAAEKQRLLDQETLKFYDVETQTFYPDEPSKTLFGVSRKPELPPGRQFDINEEKLKEVLPTREEFMADAQEKVGDSGFTQFAESFTAGVYKIPVSISKATERKAPKQTISTVLPSGQRVIQPNPEFAQYLEKQEQKKKVREKFFEKLTVEGQIETQETEFGKAFVESFGIGADIVSSEAQEIRTERLLENLEGTSAGAYFERSEKGKQLFIEKAERETTGTYKDLLDPDIQTALVTIAAVPAAGVFAAASPVAIAKGVGIPLLTGTVARESISLIGELSTGKDLKGIAEKSEYQFAYRKAVDETNKQIIEESGLLGRASLMIPAVGEATSKKDFRDNVRAALIEQGFKGKELDNAIRLAVKERAFKASSQLAGTLAIEATTETIGRAAFQRLRTPVDLGDVGLIGGVSAELQEQLTKPVVRELTKKELGKEAFRTLFPLGSGEGISEYINQQVSEGNKITPTGVVGFAVFGGFAAGTVGSGIIKSEGMKRFGRETFASLVDPLEKPGDIIADISAGIKGKLPNFGLKTEFEDIIKTGAIGSKKGQVFVPSFSVNVQSPNILTTGTTFAPTFESPTAFPKEIVGTPSANIFPTEFIPSNVNQVVSESVFSEVTLPAEVNIQALSNENVFVNEMVPENVSVSENVFVNENVFENVFVNVATQVPATTQVPTQVPVYTPPLLSLKLPKKAKSGEKFDTQVKTKGKWKTLNKKPLTERSALDYGNYLVDNSAARSFKTKKSTKKGKPVDEDFPGIFNPANYKKKGKVYIEPSKRAINTLGELRGITAKGLAAQRRKRPFKF